MEASYKQVALEDADALLAEPSAEVHFKQQYRRQKVLLILLGLIISAGIGAAVTVAVLSNKPAPAGALYSFDDVFDSNNQPKRTSIRWITDAAGTDGLSTFAQDGNIYVQALPGNATLLVDATRVVTPDGSPFEFYDYWLSPDLKKVLYCTNYQKVWRHSYTAEYYVFNVTTFTAYPINDRTPVQYAVWSPDSEMVAFVEDNDIYLANTTTGVDIRVTTDGSANIVNGVPSWVYEEEVFGTNFALWWSPNGASVAYIRYDETAVQTFTYPIYHKDQYPTQINVKYPKAGTENPTATLHVFTIQSSQVVDIPSPPTDFLTDDFYMVDLTWVSTDNSLLAVRYVARLQERAQLRLVPADGSTSTLLRQYDTNGLGWLDYPAALAIGNAQLLDLAVNAETGNVCLYRISYANLGAVEVVPLTPGADEENQDYEVLGIVGYNAETSRAFVLTTHQGPMERHLYAVDVFGAAQPEALTSGEGYFGASVSPLGGFYLVNYDGPDVPYQELYQYDNGVTTLLSVVEDNAELRARVAGFALPKYVYSTVTFTDADGAEVTVNVVELHPPLFDAYSYDTFPMLLRVYGGPSSQLVLKRFSLDWHTYLVSTHNYIVVMADVRGTGARGADFRFPVYKQLGKVEAADQTEVARQIIAKGYVDPARVSVWGWSYGGYLTSKIIEQDNSTIFEAAVAVAPVSDWRYYDTIYTERYMLTTENNADGYAASAVHATDNFANTRYLLVHGTADDNVHYQNGAVLAADLVDAGLPFEMVAYTDNDHRINTGANTQRDLYGRITRFLLQGGDDDVAV